MISTLLLLLTATVPPITCQEEVHHNRVGIGGDTQAHMRASLSTTSYSSPEPVSRSTAIKAALVIFAVHGQALRTRDPAVLRQAQANIAQRRAGLRTPIGATPGSFETPGASMLRAPHRAPEQQPAATPLMGRYGDRMQGALCCLFRSSTRLAMLVRSSHQDGTTISVNPVKSVVHYSS
jgi:hypothetical protein